MMSEIGVFFLSKSWSWCSEIGFFFDLRNSWNWTRCFVGSASCGNTTILVLKLVDCGRLRGFWNQPNHIHHHHGHLGGKSWVECKFFITTTRKRLWWCHTSKMEEFNIIRVGKLISMASGKFMWLQKRIYKCTEKDVTMKNSTQGICSKSMIGINHSIGDKIHSSVFPTDCNCSICGCMLNLQDQLQSCAQDAIFQG